MLTPHGTTVPILSPATLHARSPANDAGSLSADQCCQGRDTRHSPLTGQLESTADRPSVMWSRAALVALAVSSMALSSTALCNSTAAGGHNACSATQYCDTDGNCFACEFCVTAYDAWDGLCPTKCGGQTTYVLVGACCSLHTRAHARTHTHTHTHTHTQSLNHTTTLTPFVSHLQ
jgi:hypothetical protein